MTALLIGALAWSPQRAVREGGIVEWSQVALLVAAMVFAGVRAARVPARALDVLLALGFAAAIRAEVDLDRWILGISVVDTKFLTGVASPLLVRLAVGLAIAGIVVAAVVYTVRRRAELRREIGRLLGEPSGRALLAGAVLLVLPQAFERQLELFERALAAYVPIPRSLFEESFELLGAAYCLLGVAERALRATGRAR